MRFIILDRDGVINRDSDEYIKSPEEWVPLPGSLEAMGRLTRAGWRIAVATNQSGLARGLFDLPTLELIHAKLCAEAARLGAEIAEIAFCPHGPDQGCGCRKPKPGLFRQVAEHAGLVSLQGVPAVGDSLRDLQAARAYGATPILVKTGKGMQALGRLKDTGFTDVPVFDDLASAVTHLLNG